MKLTDLVLEIEGLDEDAIIFQEDINNYESDIILSYSEDGDGGIKTENGRKYYYLLEVFLAKEFVNDWLSSLSHVPTTNEIAKRLYEYAVNDA